MVEIKTLSIKIWLLVVDLFLIACQTIKQLILPNRKRKGNILSSLFVLFINIIKRLNQFEYGVFSMPKILKQKYIQQPILIIGGILLMLSYIEKNTEIPLNIKDVNTFTTQFSPSINKIKLLNKKNNSNPITTGILNRNQVYKVQFYASPTLSASVKKYQFTHSFII